MSSNFDDGFFKRADEHINLSNQHLADVSPGKVSASMMYSVARFNAWRSAIDYSSGEDLMKNKEEIIKYYMEQYRVMLEENMEDYIKNFNQYMNVDEQNI